MKKVIPFAFIFFLVLSMSSFCTKEDEKNLLAQQEQSIDAFISRDTSNAYNKNRDSVIVVTNKREANRIVWNPGKGNDTLAPGDTAVFAYIGYLFNAGKGGVFATNIKEIIDDGSWPLSTYPGDFGRNAIGSGYYLPGLDAGLIGMRVGEYAYILFTSKYGYGNKEVSVIPKMSPLFFEVEIINIIRKE